MHAIRITREQLRVKLVQRDIYGRARPAQPNGFTRQYIAVSAVVIAGIGALAATLVNRPQLDDIIRAEKRIECFADFVGVRGER
ncbi:MAG: hypothetical protein ACKVQU_29540 [Burkholderiales bacterium]